MDNTQSMPILEFRSSKRTITEQNDIDSEEDKRIYDVMLCIDSVDLTSLQENIFYYISGLIVKNFNQIILLILRKIFASL